MAEYDERYNTWRANDGSTHASQNEAIEHNNRGSGSADPSGMASASAGIGGILIAIASVITLVWVAGMIVGYYPFYATPILVLMVAVVLLGRGEGRAKLTAFTAALLLVGVIFKVKILLWSMVVLGPLLLFSLKPKRLLILLALAAASVGYGYFIYHPNVLDVSPFTKDYIVSPSLLHKGRDGSGKLLTELAPREKVTVNGLSRDRREFNVTTKEGLTGWVPATAFPADANLAEDDCFEAAASFFKKHRKFLARERFGDNSVSLRDRDFKKIENAIRVNYFGCEVINGHISDNSTGFTDRALRMAYPVNIAIPSLYKKYGKKEEKTNSTRVVLKYVAYTPEATIVAIETDEPIKGYDHPQGGRGKSNVSLYLKDLNTGESAHVWGYHRYSYTSEAKVIGEAIEGQYIIFPPIKSRNFSLVHEVKLDEEDNDIAWDFPEVRIPANAPIAINSPEVVAQRQKAAHIQNFKSNGSNAIVKQAAELYDQWEPKGKVIAIVPWGAVVTIVEKDRLGVVVKVRYKNFVGWTYVDNLKR